MDTDDFRGKAHDNFLTILLANRPNSEPFFETVAQHPKNTGNPTMQR